jgi:cysteine desulfurase/selenocysteine lyase
MILDTQVQKALNCRADFPVLSATVYDKDYVYLDNGATTQKPRAVIDMMTDFYTQRYATVHRGVYLHSAEATADCDAVRTQVARFIGAAHDDEIVFTKGTTESINLVASTYGQHLLPAGKGILITAMEHHANLVPWQMLCAQKGIPFRVCPIDDNGTLDMATFATLMTPDIGVVAVTHVSNALGTINPVKEITRLAHAQGAKVLLDGAQAIGHTAVNVHDLDCDFYCFSGHKLYGPTGIGVLYGKRALLASMPPYQFGGDMIESVSFEKTTFAKPPARFEAGTPPIVETLGLGAAITYVQSIGFDFIASYETALLDLATAALKARFPEVRIIGESPNKASVLSFVFPEIHPHDVGSILDSEGIAVRVGHHCAQPVMKRYGVPATVRATFSFYNTPEDVVRLMDGLQTVKDLML